MEQLCSSTAPKVFPCVQHLRVLGARPSSAPGWQAYSGHGGDQDKAHREQGHNVGEQAPRAPAGAAATPGRAAS